MPLYHSAASILTVGCALFAGGTAAIGRRFSTKTFWKDVRETKENVIQYVGETCRYLTVAPPEIDPVTGENLDKKHSVRLAMGNELRPDVWDRFKERFGIDVRPRSRSVDPGQIEADLVFRLADHFEFYGSTEGVSVVWNITRNSFGKGAVGRLGLLSGAVAGYRSTIIRLDAETERPWRDPETGFCQRCNTGEVGELIDRLPADDINTAYQGYFNNPEASNAKIIRDVFEKGDAW